MIRAGVLAVALAMSAVMLCLAPVDAKPVAKTFQCTGDAYVTNYDIGDPVSDRTGSFFIEMSTLFCHDEAGQFGYTGTVHVHRGRVQGSGWCVDPTSSEPGYLTVRADVEINISRQATGAQKYLQQWKLLRTITGASDAPIPGGRILGDVHLLGGAGDVGSFLIEPMGTPDDCYHQFETIRFYDLLAVVAPGA